jgi:hypothetical protein
MDRLDYLVERWGYSSGSVLVAMLVVGLVAFSHSNDPGGRGFCSKALRYAKQTQSKRAR